MRHSFLKGALVGGVGAMAVMASTVAVAANGDNWILGQANTATKLTSLSGASPSGMVKVTNSSSAATAPTILGTSATRSQPGVRGENLVTGSVGVQGASPGNGVAGSSGPGTGVFGTHSNTTGTAPGVRGTTSSPTGAGGLFQALTSTSGIGVQGIGGKASGIGVLGTGGSFGVDASAANSGAVAIRGTTASLANDGVQAFTSGNVSDALQGATTGSAAFAVFGITLGSGGAGVVAITSGGTGVSTSSGGGVAVSASNGSSSNPTVFARNYTADGTAGNFIGDTAVNVQTNETFGTGVRARLIGDTNGDGDPANDGNDAIYAQSDDTNNDAVITAATAGGSTELSHEAIETFGFLDVNGNARVVGNLDVTGSCCGPTIDNPLDPANSYLRHASVASPDMKNMYDGIVTTDASGRATVQLPSYFGALNRDFRYQLTVIGGGFVQAIVSKEIVPGGRSFEIRTEKGNIKVSWQVTGIRNDAYAQAHPLKVIEPKTGAAAGMYLHPELFGHAGERPLGLDLPAQPAGNNASLVQDQNALRALTRQKADAALGEAGRAQASLSQQAVTPQP